MSSPLAPRTSAQMSNISAPTIEITVYRKIEMSDIPCTLGSMRKRNNKKPTQKGEAPMRAAFAQLADLLRVRTFNIATIKVVTMPSKQAKARYIVNSPKLKLMFRAARG